MIIEYKAQGPPKLALFATHGLNHRPESLSPLFSKFAASGIQVYLYHLPDHGGERLREFTGHRDEIYFSFRKNLLEKKKEADKFNQPFCLFGFSYGALLCLRFIGEEAVPLPGLYFSPALHLRWYTHGVKWLSRWLPRLLSLPIPIDEVTQKYRYHQKGVPSSVYQQFFLNYENLQNLKGRTVFQSLSNLCWVDQKDEIVSWAGVQNWTRVHGWKMQETTHRAGRIRRPRHLNFDPSTLGEEFFDNVVKESIDHLLNS